MTPSEPAIIAFKAVSYRYPDTHQPTLAHVTLTINEGEFILVCGPSGSGKSTLLRAINGLVPHFYGGEWSGQALVADHDTRSTHPRELAHTVGFVFQDPDAQFVVEVVEDELAFAMENAGLPQTLMRRRIEEALDQVEIAHLRHRQLSTLSGGERQRVAIAAALTVQPRILVLDEPTSQLDPHTAEEVLTALQKLNADLGLTIVLSEHRLERVVQYVDRILWLPGGAANRSFRLDTPRSVLAQMPEPPPLSALGRALDWHPLPLTIKEGRRWSRALTLPPAAQPEPASQALLLEARKLSKSYGHVPALRGVDLRLHAGEIVALMGRNGSGKTTLLRHLVGLQQPDSGQVQLHGRSISKQPVEELAKTIGYVPQNPGDLLFHTTLIEELEFTLRNHGLPLDHAHIQQTLAELGIGHCAMRHPRDLSGGEAGRAALAAILVAQPRILLLDEPTRGLDYAAKQMLADLLKVQAEHGRAVLVVTHDVEFVALCAQHVVLLGEGEVVVTGSTASVLGDSLLFSTQVGKLFPGSGWLTVAEVLAQLPMLAARDQA